MAAILVREKKALYFELDISVPYYDDEGGYRTKRVDMIQSIDCERGQDTSGRRYKKKPVTSDLDGADFLSIQELEVLRGI
jgi:hypothetical protein